MSFALLQTALLMPAEMALNGLLRLDAATAARLQVLQGKTLAVFITQPAFVLYVSVNAKGLHLSPAFEAEPDASLHGSISALMKLLGKGASVTNLYGSDVELRGNTAFVQQLQNLLLDLDVDWEFQLSRLIGNLPTSLISSSFDQVGGFVRNSGEKFRQNLQDYLAEESTLLPRAHDLEAHYGAINELALRVDRLLAKVEIFSATKKNSIT